MNTSAASPSTSTPIQKLEAAVLEFVGGTKCTLKENFSGTFAAKNELGIEYSFTGSIVADLTGTPS